MSRQQPLHSGTERAGVVIASSGIVLTYQDPLPAISDYALGEERHDAQSWFTVDPTRIARRVEAPNARFSSVGTWVLPACQFCPSEPTRTTPLASAQAL